MRSLVILTLALAGGSMLAGGSIGCSQGMRGGETAATPADPDVARIHQRMIQALGGEDAWRSARYLEFDFVVDREGEEVARRSHHWDRWEGDYRVAGRRGGSDAVVIFNVNQPEEGRAWVNGQPASGPLLDSLRQSGHAWFINDSYWLLMPYKWMDPGVHLTYEGRRTEAGREWEVVRLSFEDVGLTPQNQYLALINPETGLMERWYHYRTADAEPIINDWTDWRRFGGIMLATSKPSGTSSSRIWFDNIVVRSSVPAGAFVP